MKANPLQPSLLESNSITHLHFQPSLDHGLLTAPLHPDSFCSGIRIAVTVGQWWSMLPVRLQTGAEPRFRWKSFRVAYTLFVVALIASRILLNGSAFPGFVALVGDVAAVSFSLAIILTYLRLARNWRSFSLLFLRMENYRAEYVADAYIQGVGQRMRRVAKLILYCALFEHIFDRISQFESAMKVNKYASVYDLFDDTLFKRSFAEVFVTIWLQVAGTVSAFTYIFNDMFIILISMYVSKRVGNFSDHLKPIHTKEKDKTFWENARCSYDELTKLTRQVDSHINANILVSFIQNLAFICFNLLYFLRINQESELRKIFRMFSFLYIIIRTYGVSYIAAGINDRSKDAKRKLFSVSSQTYCREVYRFIQQAANEEIALTGCNLFRITRSFILTVVGTVATYEVILLQMYN